MSDSTNPSKIKVNFDTLKSNIKSNQGTTDKSIKLVSLTEGAGAISLNIEMAQKQVKISEFEKDK